MNKMAFPSVVDDGETMSWDRGMTLRDYFAAKAMQGFFASSTLPVSVSDEELAGAAYDMADAMLKAREQ